MYNHTDLAQPPLVTVTENTEKTEHDLESQSTVDKKSWWGPRRMSSFQQKAAIVQIVVFSVDIMIHIRQHPSTKATYHMGFGIFGSVVGFYSLAIFLNAVRLLRHLTATDEVTEEDINDDKASTIHVEDVGKA